MKSAEMANDLRESFYQPAPRDAKMGFKAAVLILTIQPHDGFIVQDKNSFDRAKYLVRKEQE